MSPAFADAATYDEYESMSEDEQEAELQRLAHAFDFDSDNSALPPVFILEAFNSSFKEILAKSFRTYFGSQAGTTKAREWNELVWQAVKKAWKFISSELEKEKVIASMDASLLVTLNSFGLRLFYIYQTDLLELLPKSKPTLFGTVWPLMTEALLGELIYLLVPSTRPLEWKTMLNLVCPSSSLKFTEY